MGSILKANCSCGFNSEELFLGGGRLTFETRCMFPCYCGACESLSTSNMFELEVVCADCGEVGVQPYDEMIHPSARKRVPTAEVLYYEGYIGTNKIMGLMRKVLAIGSSRSRPEPVYDDSVFSWSRGGAYKDLVITPGKYYCPQCKSYGLTFESVGCWD
jgi:hypothetical protein